MNLVVEKKGIKMTDPTPELLAALQERCLHEPLMWKFGCVVCVAEIVQAREQAAAQRAIEEHEAELCPEDYGCEEYIAHLQSTVRGLTEYAQRVQRETDQCRGKAGTDKFCPRCGFAYSEHRGDSHAGGYVCPKSAEPKEPRG